MKISIINITTYIGDFKFEEIMKENTPISQGSFIEIEDQKYCVGNIIISNEKQIVLEVST